MRASRPRRHPGRALLTALATAGLVVGLLVAPAPLSGAPAHAAAGARPVGAGFDRGVLRWTNQERRQRGLRPLRAAPCPKRYATAHARRLAVRDRLHHQSLGPVVRACRGTRAAENVAYGGSGLTPRQVVRRWMASPGHRANLLRPAAKRIGIDASRSRGSGRTYVVQVITG